MSASMYKNQLGEDFKFTQPIVAVQRKTHLTRHPKEMTTAQIVCLINVPLWAIVLWASERDKNAWWAFGSFIVLALIGALA